MAWFDLDGFVASLAARGVPEPHLPLYREAAQALLDGAPGGRYTQAALDEALARETMTGASDRRLANLRRVGEAMLAHVGAAAATIAGVGPTVAAARAPLELAVEPRATPPAPAPVPLPALVPLPAPVPPVAAGVGARGLPPVELDLAIEPPRRAAPPPVAAVRAALAPDPPRPGCLCRERHDAYLDDYWQDIGTLYLGVAGVAGVAMARFAPPFTWLLVSSGLLAVGALITGLTVGWRCEHCRRWLAGRGLDADERADVRKRGLVFLLIAAALAVVFVVALGAARRSWHSATTPVPTLDE